MQTPAQAVRLALIGTGNRALTIYKPIFSAPNPWFELVAVCDPVGNYAENYVQGLPGVRAYTNIHDLIKDDRVEAAVVVTPIESHHAISVFLSSHKIHNLVETTWCSTALQAKDMIAKAKENGVYTRVCENFFRFPIDRFAQTLRDDGYIGDIKRIFTYNDHTGYHNNSRWIAFAKNHPEWVQSLEHTMPTMPFYEQPQRFHDDETYRARFFHFPDGLMVVDSASNIKGMLGRRVRTGYTEWQGARGTLVQEGIGYEAPEYQIHFPNGRVEDRHGAHFDWTAEIRCCDYEDTLAYDDHVRPASPNHICKVERYYENGRWAGIHAKTPKGEIKYMNQIHPENSANHYFKEYDACVMAHIVDFALQIRGLADSEFDENDALMSLMMEMGAKESALQNGARIFLPLEGELEADARNLARIKKHFGVDPLDIEAMMAVQFPRP